MRTRLPRRYVNSKCLVIGQKQIERARGRSGELHYISGNTETDGRPKEKG